MAAYQVLKRFADLWILVRLDNGKELILGQAEFLEPRNQTPGNLHHKGSLPSHEPLHPPAPRSLPQHLREEKPPAVP